MSDKFLYAGKRGTMTTLQAPGKPIGAASLTLTSPISWPTERDVIFALRKVNLADGKEVEGSYSEWRGKLTGSTIDSLALLQGTDQDYPAGDATQAYITISTSIWDALMEGLNETLNPDGTLKEDIVTNANMAPGSVTTDTLGESVVTSDKLSLDKFIDANGWTVRDYGAWKEREYTISHLAPSISSHSGVTYSNSIPKPEGYTNATDYFLTATYLSNRREVVPSCYEGASAFSTALYNTHTATITNTDAIITLILKDK